MALLLLAIGCAACGDNWPTTPTPTTPVLPDTLLSSGRIAALPAAERVSWQMYVDSSRVAAGRDLAFVRAEAQAAVEQLGADYEMLTRWGRLWKDRADHCEDPEEAKSSPLLFRRKGPV